MNLLRTDLKLNQNLTSLEIIKIEKIFDEYQRNIELQDNRIVIEWLKWQIVFKQQEFGQKILGMDLYQTNWLRKKLTKTMNTMRMEKVTSKAISKVGYSNYKSRLMEKDNAAINIMVSQLNENVPKDIDIKNTIETVMKKEDDKK